MAVGNAKKRESLKTAMRKYEGSAADRSEDRKNAKKFQAKDNAKTQGRRVKKGMC